MAREAVERERQQEQSSLFHESDTVTYLKQRVLPEIIAHAQEYHWDLRIWSVGCLTGEEPYVLAMLLTDLLAAQHLPEQFTVFATEVNDAALACARQAVYTAQHVAGLPEAYRSHFFERRADLYHLAPWLRSRVIFGHHDVRTHAPFPSLDLVVCRHGLSCLLENLPMGAVLIDRTHRIVAWNQLAQQTLAVPGQACAHEHNGMPTACNLLHTQLHQAIDTVLHTHVPLTLPNMEVANTTGEKPRLLSLSITPMPTDGERTEQVLLCLRDMTEQDLLLQEQRSAIVHLQARIAALEATNAQLSLANLALHTSNAQLSAANEALQAEQERLTALVEQGAQLQEELMTFNEELQASNEELLEQTQARQEAEHLNRLKDEFLLLASHELRTPLTVILGLAKLLQLQTRRQHAESGSSMALPTEQQRMVDGLNTIIGRTIHMAGLIRNMLDVARLHGDVFALHERLPLDLVPLVRHVVEQQAAMTRRTLRYETEENALICLGDAGRIEQVLNNLIGNALKYSATSSPVVVTVKRRLTAHAPGALIAVRDQGPGIRRDQQATIFHRFYRGPTQEHQNEDGLGLGLYVAREIVSRHRGRLWVESTVGLGSTFFVTLPLQEK